jgi:hypothetical protein
MNMNAFTIPNPFLQKFIGMKKEIAEKHFNTYLTIVRNELLRQLPYIEDNIVNINLNKLWNYQFKYKNTIYYIWKEFSNLLPFVYISNHNTGNNLTGLLSKGMIINQKYIDLLIDTIDTKQLVDMFYGSYEDSNMVMIPIDMKSTKGYIASTEYQLNNTNTNENHRNKMIANLRQAKYIKLIADHYYSKYGCYVLPHIPNKSEYGRTYYKGLSLQNCSKEVRAAALGTHYQYDLYAAIFAIKLYLAEEILKPLGKSVWREFTYTTDYLENKDMIRKRLSKHIQAYPDGIKLVKQAITSIGFGSRISDGSWLEGLVWQTTSIKDIIKNKYDLERFITDDWVKQFHMEQKELTKLIVNHYLEEPNFVEKITNLRDIKSANGNWSKQRIMSYLFQHSETLIIDIITENINPIIKIHDAFLVKDKIPTEQLLNIKRTLNEVSEFFKIELTEVQGWNSFDAITEEIRHKEFIKHEELKANNGIMPIKYTKKYSKISIQSDSKVYDGYDDGKRYEQYNPETDESIHDMTPEELREHYRILGIEKNTYPEFIKKLL